MSATAIASILEPVVFTIGVPNVGDQGRYETMFVGTHGPVEPPANSSYRRVDFEWLRMEAPPQTGPGAPVVPVVRISTEGPPGPDYVSTDVQVRHLIDAGRDRPIGSFHLQLQFDNVRHLNYLHPFEGVSGDWIFFGPSEAPEARADALCDVLLPTIGLEVRMNQGALAVRNGCLRGMGLLDQATGSFVPINITEGDGRIMVWEQWFPGASEASSRYWFREHLPYPVRVEHFHENVTAVRVLTSFTAGGNEFAWPTERPAPWAEPLVASNRVARPWLIDDAGVDHPFPLSAAFAAALAHPTCSLFAEFVAQHPTAFVYLADHTRLVREDGAEADAWGFRIGLGEEAVEVRIRQERYLGSSQNAPGNPVQCQATAMALGGLLHPPDPDKLPKTLPTAMDLVTAWARISGEAPENVTSWGFKFGCMNGCAGQPPVVLHLRAGVWQYPIEGAREAALERAPENVVATLERSASFTPSGRWEANAILLNATDSTGTAFRLFQWGVGARSGHPSPYKPDSSPHLLTVQSTTAPDLARLHPVWESGAVKVAWYVTVAGLLMGVVYYLVPAARIAAMGFFARVQGEQVRDHPKRQQILAEIKSRPGIHFRALGRATKLAEGVLRHHVTKLEEAHLVKVIRGNGFTCYFPGGHDVAGMRTAPLLRSATARGLLDAVRADPGIAQSAVARALGVTPAAVHRHVKALEKVGVLSRGKSGELFPS